MPAGSQVFGAISTTRARADHRGRGTGLHRPGGLAQGLPRRPEQRGQRLRPAHGRHHPGRQRAEQPHAQLAPTSGATATALDNLAQTVAILAKNSSQFETLLQSLDNLSTQGRSILENVLPPDRDPAADAAGGERPACAAPGRPGRPPRRDPRRPTTRCPRRCATATCSSTRTSSSAACRAGARTTASRPSPARRIGRRRLVVITRRLIVNLVVVLRRQLRAGRLRRREPAGQPAREPDHAHHRVRQRVGPLLGLRGRAQRRPRRHGDLDRADQDGHQGDDAHQSRAPRCRRRAVVGPDRQRPGRAGGQPGAHPRRPRARARQRGRRAGRPRRRAGRRRCRGGLGHPAAPGHPGQRPQQAHRRDGDLAAGQAGNLRTLVSAGTTFSKEFVAYQQQFTELLANAPPALDAVTAVAPAAAPGPGQHRRARAGAGPAEDGTAHPAHRRVRRPSTRWTTSSRPSRPTSAASCTTRPTSSRTSPSPPTSRTCRRGSRTTSTSSARSSNIAVAGSGQAHHDERAQDPNQTFLRTRLLIPPSSTSRRSPTARRSTIPDTLPGRRLRDGVRQRCRPGHPAGLHARRRRARGGPDGAGGRRRAASATPAGPSPARRTACRPTARASCSPSAGWWCRRLFLAWGARPSRRRHAPAGLRDVPCSPRRRAGRVTHTEGERRDMTIDGRHNTDERGEGGRRDRHRTDEGADAGRVAAHGGGSRRTDGDRARPRAGGPSGWSASLATLGLVGTLVFGILYATKSSGGAGAGPGGLERVRAPS